MQYFVFIHPFALGQTYVIYVDTTSSLNIKWIALERVKNEKDNKHETMMENFGKLFKRIW